MDALVAMTHALAKLEGEDTKLAHRMQARRLINLLGDEGFEVVETVASQANRMADDFCTRNPEVIRSVGAR